MTDDEIPTMRVLDATGALKAMGLMLRSLIDSHPDPKALTQAWYAYSASAKVDTTLEVNSGGTTPAAHASLMHWLGIFDTAVASRSPDHPRP